MRRLLVILAAASALLGVASSAAAATPTQIYRDYADNGRLDGHYSQADLQRALKNAVGFQRMSGQPWREIVQEGLAMKKAQELNWSQVVMAANTPMLLKKAMVDGRPDLGVMASGQVVGMIDELPSVAELITRIMKEADEVLERLGS